MSKRISDPKIKEKFREWIRENTISPENVDFIDVEAEFGTDLSFDEAIRLAIQESGKWIPKVFVIRNPSKSFS
jgi:hypothetical protein